MKFMTNAGFDMSDAAGPPPAAPDADPEQDLADATRFFDHELRGTTRFVPDLAALRNVPVVVGVGVDSTPLLTYETSAILAQKLGVELVVFPGDHAGFLGDATAFAEVLRRVL
jgi:hypothetical protein